MALLEWQENIDSKKCSWDWHVKKYFSRVYNALPFQKLGSRDSWRKPYNFTEKNEILHGLNESTPHMGTWFTIQYCVFWHFSLSLGIVALQQFTYRESKIDIILRKTACFLLHIPFTFIELSFAHRRVQINHKCRGWWTQSHIKFSLLTLQMNAQECCSVVTLSYAFFFMLKLPHACLCDLEIRESPLRTMHRHSNLPFLACIYWYIMVLVLMLVCAFPMFSPRGRQGLEKFYQGLLSCGADRQHYPQGNSWFWLKRSLLDMLSIKMPRCWASFPHFALKLMLFSDEIALAPRWDLNSYPCRHFDEYLTYAGFSVVTCMLKVRTG